MCANVSSRRTVFAYAHLFLRVSNNGIIVMSQKPDTIRDEYVTAMLSKDQTSDAEVLLARLKNIS